MKNNTLLLGFLPVLFMLLFSRCENLLDPVPQTTIAPENVFSSANGIRAALTTCYSNELAWASYFNAMLPDPYGNPDVNMGGDNPTAIAFSHGIVTPTTDFLNQAWQSIWVGFYRSVNYSNFLIENEEKFSGISEIEKVTIIAEAKFIRAKAYFFLVQFFGDVPLLTRTFESLENDRYPERKPIAEVYQLIIDDLEFGVTNLPQGPFTGHAMKGAAQGLLAKVYMSAPVPLKNYPRADELTEEIINSGIYDLEDNFADLWYHSGKNKANRSKECIYGCILTSLGDFKGGSNQFLASPRSPAPWYIPRKSFIGEFIKWNDTVRLQSTFMFVNEPGYTTGYYLYKFMNADWRTNLVPQMKGEGNEYYLRYADILLLRAEILNEINNGPTQEAIDLVNEVRTRAKINTISLAEFPGKNEFLLALIKERKHELIFEGHLFFDLKRMGKATELLWNMDDKGNKVSNFQEYQLLMPIPEIEMAVNTALVQNPGY